MRSPWLSLGALLAACTTGGTTWLGELVLVDGPGGIETGGSSGEGGAGLADLAGAAGDGGMNEAFFSRYEAESSSNTLTYPVQQISDGYSATCPIDGVHEGADCASGGKAVRVILGRSPCEPATSSTSYDNCQDLGGGITFNEVSVPADGIYDVTWWYHCGADPSSPGRANVYGDTNCGGLDYQTGPGTGCRPHLIDVNGVPMSTTIAGEVARYYHFPCYAASWDILHGATTAIPLRAGKNTVYIHAPGARTLDAADIDAMDVQSSGTGTAKAPLWPKLVTPVVAGN